jgi:branched-chain amino acid transport system substrate-binding protein
VGAERRRPDDHADRSRDAGGEPFAIGVTPIDLAVGEGAVWVASGTPSENTQFAGPVLDAVTRLDPDTSSVSAVVDIPHEGTTIFGGPRQRLAVAAGSLWIVLPSGSVARVDPASGRVAATVDGIGAYAIASDGRSVWILDSDGTVKRISPQTNGITARFVLQATGLDSLAVGGGDVWAASSADGVVWRITVARQPVVSRTIEVEPGIGALAYRDGALWVANGLQGTVSRVDPATNDVVATIAVGNTPYAVAADAEGLWVAVQGGAESVAASSRVEGIEALPSTICGSPVYGGESSPDVLVVSDLPLQGGSRFASVQMEQAIEYVLRQRGFRAGPYGVAYQSCDDSLASTGLFDPDKCAANARAYAANRRVVAVIGTLNSGCAVAAIPVLNEAEGGPLAMISPANSLPGLTRQSLDAPPNVEQELYPTGTRNYVRVYATDDMQAAGLVTLARDELGAGRIFVVHDGDAYGEIVAAYARVAVERAGLELVGSARWDPQADGYDQLVDDVAAVRPEAVIVSGLLDSNGAAVVSALREALGADVPILVPDGFTPLSLFVEQAGDAAKGVYVSTIGLPDLELAALSNALPAEGVRFVRGFAATQPGGVDLFAVYAAQAAEVLLDAIARSDGSRGSVIRELFATRVEGGILGSFTFDANGDTSLNPVSIYRVAEGGGGNEIASVEGGVLDRVIVPDPSLVR